MKRPVLAIHGGAGDIVPAAAGLGKEAAARRTLEEVLFRGIELLARGGSAFDAVVLAVTLLEDAELFNAGRGSVLNSDGTVEMDAAVMEGTSGKAGAVASVRTIRNPVLGARLVMERSPHVLLCGGSADRFAVANGAEPAPPEYFLTEARKAQLDRVRRHEVDAEEGASGGTVGAVARDSYGRLAAATSTGGVSGKLPGRIGDTPVIGAGTWADDAVCAVSATGDGEFFIRCSFAHEIDAGIRIGGLDTEAATWKALHRVSELGGRGGCIVVAPRGDGLCCFTTAGMYRGTVRPGEPPAVALFGGEGFRNGW